MISSAVAESGAIPSAKRPGATETPLTYRPALDGVRTIAVYLVVAFHAEMSPVSGGFLGVDIFFVLSGYLVTRVVLGGLTSGEFGMAEFYSRRIRRLLPVALLVLSAVTVMWLLIAGISERAAVLGDVRAATLYFSNWHFAAEATDYFAVQENPSPVLHYWSLSVEEQFYIAWPLLLVAVWRLTGSHAGRAATAWFTLTVVLSAASIAALYLTLSAGLTDLAYYGTHARVYQLLGGAALAVGIQFWRWTQVRRVVALLAAAVQPVLLLLLFVLASPLFEVGAAVRGVCTAMVTIGLLWTLEAASVAPAASLLSRPGPVYLGKISYGTYLWHFPVTVLIRRYVELSPTLLFALVVVVATGLAALSNRALEVPVRQSRSLVRKGPSVVVVGLVTSLLAGAVVFPHLLRLDHPPVVRTAAVHTGTTLPDAERIPVASIDLDAASAIPRGSPAEGPLPRDRSCVGPVSGCIVVNGKGKKVLVLGDSHALMLMPALRAIAQEQNLTLAVAAATGCPWPPGLIFARDKGNCTTVRPRWYSSLVREFNPDVIMLVSRATDHKVGSTYGVASDDPRFTGSQSQLLAAAARATVEQLAGDRSRTIAVFEPVPVSEIHSRTCLEGARFADECKFVTDAAPSAAERTYRAFDDTMPNVYSVDIDGIACPRLPVCDAVSGGTVVRKDHDHFTDRWSAMNSDELRAVLRTTGVL